MRSPFTVFSRERVKNHVSTCHGLTLLKSKGVQCQRALHTQNLDYYFIDIASSLKIGFQAPFDSACPLFHSLSGILGFPLLSLSLSRFVFLHLTEMLSRDKKTDQKEHIKEFGGGYALEVCRGRFGVESETSGTSCPDVCVIPHRLDRMSAGTHGTCPRDKTGHVHEMVQKQECPAELV